MSYLDGLLSAINDLVWPSCQSIDAETATFYLFKPFPTGLKRQEVEKWAELQSRTLSPFTKGDAFSYLSRQGLHLWITAGQFCGVPETANQSPLSDGQHYIKGQHQSYLQQWSSEIMLSCEPAEINADEASPQPSAINTSKPWALPREIDKRLQNPTSWLVVCGFVSLCAITWAASGYMTLSLQEYYSQQQSVTLSQEIGPKLAQQQALNNNILTLNGLKNWHTEFGFFPESFAAISEKLSHQGSWRANSILWQERRLELEFVANEIDLTTLVGELESVNILSQVNIRPHNAKDTWILEAQLK
jgi:hypothetical protein